VRPRTGPPWIWLAFLAFGVVAVGIVFVALAAEEEERPERRGAERPEVPELTALDYRIASDRVERMGLVADSYPVQDAAPAGTVVSQEPAAGTRVARDHRVVVNVSTGPGRVAPLPVPELTGFTAERARQIARERGFTVRTLEQRAAMPEEVGQVVLQEPESGGRAPALTQITLYVGR